MDLFYSLFSVPFLYEIDKLDTNCCSVGCMKDHSTVCGHCCLIVLFSKRQDYKRDTDLLAESRQTNQAIALLVWIAKRCHFAGTKKSRRFCEDT